MSLRTSSQRVRTFVREEKNSTSVLIKKEIITLMVKYFYGILNKSLT